MRGTLTKKWGPLDCEECSPTLQHKRRCPKLSGPLRAAAEERGWTPCTSGPECCPRLALERDARTLRLLDQHAALDQWGAWPHSPGDMGAQPAAWAAAMRVIKGAHRDADTEIREDSP